MGQWIGSRSDDWHPWRWVPRSLRRCAGLVGALVTALALGASPATGAPGSLPDVSVGPRPGPAALYAPASSSPLFANVGRWSAPPTMVSGTQRYDRGEYIHTDYIYDDHGAETGALPGVSPEPRPSRRSVWFAPPTGDLVYPTDEDRYGFNAADLLELRVGPDDDAVAYRVTLNTMLVADAAAVAIGIDVDGGEEGTDWGHGLGTLGPLGVDHVIYSDGVQAQIDGEVVPVTTDVDRNQIEVIVPRDLLDPGPADVWRHYAVVGLADGEGGFTPVQSQPSSERPGGAGTQPDPPPVFNVAFRFEERSDEPLGLMPSTPSRGPYGTWREHAQAHALGARDISAFVAEIDFGKLRSGVVEDNVPATGFSNRLYVSSLDLGEGVAGSRPWFLGRVQPYTAYVPTTYDESDPPGLMLVLHSLAANHNQFQAASPDTYIDLAEDRNAVAITTLGRGPDGWYQREAELEVFEVWAEVARLFALDPDRAVSNGYSMGGYGTFKLVSLYPDLFARAFPVVGPPGEGIAPITDPRDPGEAHGPPEDTDTTPLLDNVRNVPFLIWNGTADELVPATGVITHAQRLDALGYRYLQDVFAADHFLLAVIDDWTRARDFLTEDTVERDPAHVTHRVLPSRHVPEYGLVHDKAYWVWDIEVADADGPEGGLVDALSLADGLGHPVTSRVVGGGPDPLPYVRRGQEWISMTEVPAENRIELTLDNVASLTLGIQRAGLDLDEDAVLTVETGTGTRLSIAADFQGPVSVRDGEGGGLHHERHAQVITVPLDAGQHTVVIAGSTVPLGEASRRDRALPATGGGTGAAVAILLAAMLVNRRRPHAGGSARDRWVRRGTSAHE